MAFDPSTAVIHGSLCGYILQPFFDPNHGEIAPRLQEETIRCPFRRSGPFLPRRSYNDTRQQC